MKKYTIILALILTSISVFSQEKGYFSDREVSKSLQSMEIRSPEDFKIFGKFRIGDPISYVSVSIPNLERHTTDRYHVSFDRYNTATFLGHPATEMQVYVNSQTRVVEHVSIRVMSNIENGKTSIYRPLEIIFGTSSDSYTKNLTQVITWSSGNVVVSCFYSIRQEEEPQITRIDLTNKGY